MTRAPWASATATVSSVEPESTTTRSSVRCRTAARVRPMRSASLCAMTKMESGRLTCHTPGSRQPLACGGPARQERCIVWGLRRSVAGVGPVGWPPPALMACTVNGSLGIAAMQHERKGPVQAARDARKVANSERLVKGRSGDERQYISISCCMLAEGAIRICTDGRRAVPFFSRVLSLFRPSPSRPCGGAATDIGGRFV